PRARGEVPMGSRRGGAAGLRHRRPGPSRRRRPGGARRGAARRAGGPDHAAAAPRPREVSPRPRPAARRPRRARLAHGGRLPDAAGVGAYYAPYAAHDLLRSFRPGELGIGPLLFTETFFCRRCGAVASTRTCPHGAAEQLALSGTKVRESLRGGAGLPPEFTRPEGAAILAEWAQRG